MKVLIAICLALISIDLQAQSLSIFNIDTTNFPIMKAKFYAFDKDGNQITNLSPTDFEIKEDGIDRKVLNVSCPIPEPLQKVSIAMSIDVSGSMGYSNFGEIPVELGKTTANELCNLVAMPPSEFALQTCHHRALIVQDFTSDKDKVITAINPIKANGGNNFVEHLLNKLTGLLNITKTGKYKRVAILYTDAWWYSLTTDELQQCKDTCSKYNIQFFAVIYSRPESEPNGIKKSLQELADFTGGFLFDGVTTTKAAKEIGLKLNQTAQGGDLCTIEWQSGIACVAGNKNVELLIKNLNLTAKASYPSPKTSVAKLGFNPLSIKFKDPLIGVKVEQKVTVTARNSNVTVTNITSNNAGFEITPKNFVLNSGQSIELTVTYLPVDSSYNYCSFDIENDVCKTKYYVSGGWKGKEANFKTLNLIHPNGGEVFVVGSENLITWEGIAPDEKVKLEYRTDDNKPWITITDSAVGLKYLWRTPNNLSKMCRIRVTFGSKVIEDDEFVKIPKGTFLMGNTGKFKISGEENKVHEVTISNDFYLNKYEVNQKQFRDIMGFNPSYFKGDSLPVEKVTWFQAIEFCNKLSDIEGLQKCYSGYNVNTVCDWNSNGYRLPTEAEWEYACKAVTSTDLYNGDITETSCTFQDDNLRYIAWYCSNSSHLTHKIGEKQPNPFGLYDISGNVAEWCWDWFGSYQTNAELDPRGSNYKESKIYRGGSFLLSGIYCRSSSRRYSKPQEISNFVGFRVCRNYVNLEQDKSYNLQDTSDNFWSIVAPLAKSKNIVMGKQFLNNTKDSLVQNFVVNSGSWRFRVDSIYFRGADAAAFSLMSGLPKYELNEKEGKNTEFRFLPKKVGIHQADIVIITQSDTLIQKISGEGVAPELAVNSNWLDFGRVPLKYSKTISDTILLTNISQKEIKIDSIGNIGPDATQFIILDDTKAFTLQSNESKKLNIKFEPKEVGRTSGQVAFFYNNFSSPAIVQLFGEGIDIKPKLNSNNPVCEGERIMLFADSIDGAKFFWTGPNNFKSTEQNPIIDDANNSHIGSYSASVIYDIYSSDTSNIDVMVGKFDISPGDSSLIFLGSAERRGISIQLTYPRVFDAGSIWLKNKFSVLNDFSTSFQFITGNGNNNGMDDGSIPGADGFALVFQNNNYPIEGARGGSIGYTGIPKSLAIEIDLFNNDWDENGNHIAVQSLKTEGNQPYHNNSTSCLGINQNILEIKHGKYYFCKVDYIFKEKELKIYIDSTGKFDEVSLIVPNIDFSDYLQLDGKDHVFIGITSATGNAFQNHNILNWRFPCKNIILSQDEVTRIIPLKNELMIYPNPASNNLNIIYSLNKQSDIQFKIINNLGIEMLTEEIIKNQEIGQYNYQINIDELPQGIYHCILKTNTEQLTEMFFKID